MIKQYAKQHYVTEQRTPASEMPWDVLTDITCDGTVRVGVGKSETGDIQLQIGEGPKQVPGTPDKSGTKLAPVVTISFPTKGSVDALVKAAIEIQTQWNYRVEANISLLKSEDIKIPQSTCQCDGCVAVREQRRRDAIKTANRKRFLTPQKALEFHKDVDKIGCECPRCSELRGYRQGAFREWSAESIASIRTAHPVEKCDCPMCIRARIREGK